MNIVRGRYAGGWVIFLLNDVLPVRPHLCGAWSPWRGTAAFSVHTASPYRGAKCNNLPFFVGTNSL